MPPAKRRKIEPAFAQQENASKQEDTAALESQTLPNTQESDDSLKIGQAAPADLEAPLPDKNKERQERFKALQARAVSEARNEARLQQEADSK